MEYKSYKEQKPEKTVSKIKKILNKQKIYTNETFCQRNQNDAAFVTIRINGAYNVGADGRGIDKASSLASGYAKLIEKLQTQFLYKPTLFQAEPDEKIVEISEFDNYPFSQKEIFKGLNKLLVKEKEMLSLKYNKEIGSNYKEGSTVVVPFVSVKTKKEQLLPINEIKFLQGSNGCTSGNTFEEAIVHGLSEICARFSMKKIFENKINLPIIPKDAYENYEKIVELIEYIENNGIKITLKDASLGMNLPVVCAIFEDQNSENNSIHISFGAHPTLPIAIEKAITKFLQDNMIENETARKRSNHINTYDTDSTTRIVKILAENYCAFSKNSKHIENLLSEKANYEYTVETWHTDKKANNKIFEKELIQKLLKISDDIYIRNYTYLDFPTVYIYVPGISEINSCIDMENYLNLIKWIEFSFKKVEDDSVESLLEAVDFLSSKIYDGTVNLSKILPEYWAFLCAIVMNDTEKRKNYGEKLIYKLNFIASEQTMYFSFEFIEALVKYYNLLLENKTEKEIEEYLINNFSEKIYQQIIAFSQRLNFNIVKAQLQKFADNKGTHIYSDEIMKSIQENTHKLYMKKTPKQKDVIRKI